jgi:hypothetical protein
LEALRETADKTNRVRFGQKIDLIFSLNQNQDKVIVKTCHSFSYENLGFAHKKCLLDIFSDFRCDEVGKRGEQYDFHFDRIKIYDQADQGHPLFDQIYDNISETDKEKMKKIVYNKLFWQHEFKMKPRSKYTVVFEIHSEYDYSDRMV